MHNANKCPKCKQYILGTKCFICNIDLANIEDIFENNIFNDIFSNLFKEKEK